MCRRYSAARCQLPPLHGCREPSYWLIAGLFIAQDGLMLLTADPSTFGRTFLGIGIVGGIAVSTLIFLTADAFWQRQLPTFFPDGSFQGVGVVRVTVGQRLIATFLLTGLMPLAVFGAPIRQPDHALRAVSAAWSMNRALAEFNAKQVASP